MIHTKQISSKYDFAIIKGKHIMLVDEDKHIKNTGPSSAWGEYRIAGELIAGAYCNYSSKKTYKEKLYAVRVIGLRFTFYRAIIPYEYLDSLGEGIPSMHIYMNGLHTGASGSPWLQNIRNEMCISGIHSFRESEYTYSPLFTGGIIQWINNFVA